MNLTDRYTVISPVLLYCMDCFLLRYAACIGCQRVRAAREMAGQLQRHGSWVTRAMFLALTELDIHISPSRIHDWRDVHRPGLPTGTAGHPTVRRDMLLPGLVRPMIGKARRMGAEWKCG